MRNNRDTIRFFFFFFAEHDGNNIVWEVLVNFLLREMKLRENSIALRPLINAQLSQRESADGAGSDGNFF